MMKEYFKQLAYEETGKENKNTILFLHSKLLDKWMWKKQKEAHDTYFKNCHCIFLDLPNHGESRNDNEFSIEKSSEEIHELIDHIITKKNIDKINIVALGIGTSIAIEILNRNPSVIDKLVLSGLEISDFKEDEEESIINRLAKTQSEYLNEKPDSFIVKAYLRYFGIPKEYFDDAEKILDRSVKDERKIAYESLNYTLPNELMNNDKLLEKEEILIIYGSKEDLNCTKSAIGLKKLFKNGKLVEITKGNHLWNIIDFELFNKVIIDFIELGIIEENSKVKILE